MKIYTTRGVAPLVRGAGSALLRLRGSKIFHYIRLLPMNISIHIFP